MILQSYSLFDSDSFFKNQSQKCHFTVMQCLFCLTDSSNVLLVTILMMAPRYQLSITSKQITIGKIVTAKCGSAKRSLCGPTNMHHATCNTVHVAVRIGELNIPQPVTSKYRRHVQSILAIQVKLLFSKKHDPLVIGMIHSAWLKRNEGNIGGAAWTRVFYVRLERRIGVFLEDMALGTPGEGR